MSTPGSDRNKPWLGASKQAVISKRIQKETVFYLELRRRIEALPGVEAASLTDKLPMDLNDVLNIRAKGQTYRQGEIPSAFSRLVDENYFKTLRIPLRIGRNFESQDRAFDWHATAGREQVAIVNERLARNLWPGEDAVGRIALVGSAPDSVECKVVGVVGDVRQSGLEIEAGPEIYALGQGRGELVVRTRGTLEASIPAVRAALRQIDPNMPTDEFRPLRQVVDRAVSPKRLVTLLLGLFSLLALILASVGIYGVIAYSVSQRTHEIGIRLALGSPRAAVLRLIFAEGMPLVLIGGAIGLMASMAVTRVIQSLLFEVRPDDPLTFSSVALLLAGIGLFAC